MNKTVKKLIIAASVFVVLLMVKPVFVLEEGFQAVVIRFGKLTKTEVEAGLKYKTPFVDDVLYYPKKIFSWDGEPRQVPTSEQQYVWVDSTARWKIEDPALFYQSLKTVTSAQGKLDDIIESSLKTVISQYPLIESVRSSNMILESDEKKKLPVESDPIEDSNMRTEISTTTNKDLDPISYGRKELSEKMLEMAAPNVKRFGIELIDVVIRQIKFNDKLTQSVHERMIQERKQIAQFNRSYGEGQKEDWLGKLEKDKQTIISEAKAKAEEIKGDADAKAAAIYADAYSRDGEFYRFWKAMESYKKTFPKMDKVLTTDMDYFEYLHDRE